MNASNDPWIVGETFLIIVTFAENSLDQLSDFVDQKHRRGKTRQVQQV